MSPSYGSRSPQQLPVVIRDNRRIDPVTLRPRRPDRGTAERDSAERDRYEQDRAERNRAERKAERNGVETERARPEGAGLGSSARSPAESGRDAVLEERLAERTADLQRLKAEYDNYRKRVQRDRLAVREIAVANVLGGLLPVLDAVDRAREYGELTGGMQAVVEVLEGRLAALGLESVGAEGEPFDPAWHEAVTHEVSAAVDRPTCGAVLRRGYRVGRQLLRPAEVAVVEPPEPAPSSD
ncbi:nucleotide exchange factor GrpE [Streptomyces sp. NPDC015346]|uniref:nucleotide exchange factor GrpE n=1 Tax=Streptomyces sp. NPDC015346 TaxID=3364954 RepID=UPI003702F675